MKPKVTLINSSPDPLETVYILWEASKVDGPVPMTPEEVRATVPREKVEALFWQVLAQHIPVAEHIHFTFILDGISVSLREQMVRHRIGTRVGDRVGVDIIPDIAASSWWSQSMRIQDMGAFADNEMYRVPDTLTEESPGGRVDRHIQGPDGGVITADQLFRRHMRRTQDAYNELVKAGVPMEDARELIPLGAQHRISWDINLQALLHVLGKRGCWILQLGIWGPVILGMVDELAKKVHPMFARIVAPPCIGSDDKFKGCTYQKENERRITQEDRLPPCPLWLSQDPKGRAVLEFEAENNSDEPGWKELLRHGTAHHEVLIQANDLVPRHREMKQRAEDYRQLWKHDPYTWEPEQ